MSQEQKRPAPRLSKRTGIDDQFLFNGELPSASAAQKMSLAGERQTTRPEDIGYYLLGIFNISMSMRYGEGEKAVIRLQREILEEYYDLHICMGRFYCAKIRSDNGVLASHPRFFKNCSDFKS
ncbi:hypothetical protein BKA56DRAFT_615432 [Ilyonectria sp. MPI-CAGE-AT-0026]|nr:hypothetical protein BKA56DRAFT_615432 [Ilyonectria sp. MPI-CAGE-AT-0026]